MSHTPPLPDSSRMELAMAAASSERANRPSFLVVLAAIVLAGALIYALTGLSARPSATARVQSSANSTRQIIDLVEEVKASTTGLEGARFAPNPRLASELEQLAADVQLDLAGNVTSMDTPGATAPGLSQKRYSVKAANQDPAVILNFLNQAQDPEKFPGLEVYTLFLRPNASSAAPGFQPSRRPGSPVESARFEGGWEMEVEFVRLERKV